MATPRTECTELAVGFGLLAAPIQNQTPEQIQALFEGSLTNEKYIAFAEEYRSDQEKYSQFYNVGHSLREGYSLFRGLAHMRWAGPEQQAQIVGVAKDLLANNVPLSVKDESNIVINPSPYNLFISLPSGNMPAGRSPNWFLYTDREEFQAAYDVIRIAAPDLALPADVEEFERTARAADRDRVQEVIKNLSVADSTEFFNRYVQMCRTVARLSAEMFNENIAATRRTNRYNSMLENVIKQFFRVNAVTYILAGLENKIPFAVEIPDLTAWKQAWRILSVRAVPQLQKAQGVVNFEMVVENKVSHEHFEPIFHDEIRWSHGKFCGNPEAKLYKTISWRQLPFFRVIL